MVDDHAAVLDRVVGDHARHAAGHVDLDHREVGTARVDLGRVDAAGHVEPWCEVLLGDLAERLDQAREAAHRAPADEGAAAGRAGVGVSLHDVDQCRVHAQLARREEAECLGMALAGLGTAGVDLDPPRLADPDPGAVVARDGRDAAPAVLGRAGTAVLVEEPDPDPEEAALRAGSRLPPPQLRVAGTQLEAAQQLLVVTGVEVAAGRAATRELGDRVAPAQLEGVEPELGGDDVDHPLARVGARVHPHSAVGAGRAFAAGDGAGVVADGTERVRSEEGLGGRHRLEGGAEGEDRVGADIGDHGRIGSQETAVAVEGEPDADLLLVRVRAGEQVLPPVLHPADWPPQTVGEGGDHDLFREDVGLEPEASPDLGRDDPHRPLRQPQAAGDQGPRQVRHLGRGPDRQPLAVGRGDDPAVLEWERRLAGRPKSALENQRRPGELGLNVAALEPGVEENPVRSLRVERLAAHRPVVEEDTLGEVLGPITVGAEGDGHRLSDEADAAVGERRLAGRSEAGTVDGDRLQVQRPGVEDVVWQRRRAEGGVGDRRADEGRLERAWQSQVGEVSRRAHHLHRVLATSRIASTIG